MNNLRPDSSDQSLLRQLDHHETSGEFERLVSIELQHKNVQSDQSQESISIPRSHIGQSHENSIVLPHEIEILIDKDPESLVDKELNAILERRGKRMIRRSFIFCLTMALGYLSLEFAWGTNIHFLRVIFAWCYAFLIYLLIENIIQSKTPEILSWRKIENICTIIDIAIFLLMTLATDLKLNLDIEFPVKILLAPSVANFFFYALKSQAPINEKFIPFMSRLVFMLTLPVIIFKLTDDLDMYWATTLMFVHVPFTLVSIYCLLTAFAFIFLACASLYHYCIRRNRTLASKNFGTALGCLWLCLGSSNGISLIILMTLHLEGSKLLLSSLIITKNLNFAFCLFTLLFYKKLKAVFITQSSDAPGYRKALEKILYPERSPIIKMQVNVELTRLSSTYFTSSKDNGNNKTKQSNFDNIDNDTNNEHLCYICCYEAPNAVMAKCGHGGVCVDCAIATVKARAKCMECREKVQVILKMDLSSEKEDNVKAVEAIIINKK